MEHSWSWSLVSVAGANNKIALILEECNFSNELKFPFNHC